MMLSAADLSEHARPSPRSFLVVSVPIPFGSATSCVPPAPLADRSFSRPRLLLHRRLRIFR